MHDAMQYDPSNVKVTSHCLKVGNPSIFKSYLLCHLQWQLAATYYDHIFLNGRIFDIFLVFVSRNFELGRNVSCD